MSRKPKHRDTIVQAALTLFRRRGYSGTGVNDIVALSGAPKGSLYHYFPDGKLSIAEAAVRQAGENVTRTLETLAADNKTPGKLVRAYAALIGQWMAKSKFRDGGPITTILLETVPGDAKLTAAGRTAFAAWRGAIASRLTAQGVAAARAERLAALVIAAIEGSLIQARVEGHAGAIDAIARELEALLDTAVKEAKR
jgi:TetR/AcrR family transcriptional regulator, lmrAB and yxaGH operons repressor